MLFGLVNLYLDGCLFVWTGPSNCTMTILFNSMNVTLGLCHIYSGEVVTFQESFFACKRKLLSKTTPTTTPNQQQWGTIVVNMVMSSIRTMWKC